VLALLTRPTLQELGWRVVLDQRTDILASWVTIEQFSLSAPQQALCSVLLTSTVLDQPAVSAALAYHPQGDLVALLQLQQASSWQLHASTAAGLSSTSPLSGNPTDNYVLMGIDLDCTVTYAFPQTLQGSYNSISVDVFGGIHIAASLMPSDGGNPNYPVTSALFTSTYPASGSPSSEFVRAHTHPLFVVACQTVRPELTDCQSEGSAILLPPPAVPSCSCWSGNSPPCSPSTSIRSAVLKLQASIDR